MKLQKGMAVVVCSLALSAQAQVCVSESGARVQVEKNKVLKVSGQIPVRSKTAEAVVFQGYSEVLLSLNCEHGTFIKFDSAASRLIAVCSHHTGLETFTASLFCEEN